MGGFSRSRMRMSTGISYIINVMSYLSKLCKLVKEEDDGDGDCGEIIKLVTGCQNLMMLDTLVLIVPS